MFQVGTRIEGLLNGEPGTIVMVYAFGCGGKLGQVLVQWDEPLYSSLQRSWEDTKDLTQLVRNEQ